MHIILFQHISLLPYRSFLLTSISLRFWLRKPPWSDLEIPAWPRLKILFFGWDSTDQVSEHFSVLLCWVTEFAVLGSFLAYAVPCREFVWYIKFVKWCKLVKSILKHFVHLSCCSDIHDLSLSHRMLLLMSVCVCLSVFLAARCMLLELAVWMWCGIEHVFDDCPSLLLNDRRYLHTEATSPLSQW